MCGTAHPDNLNDVLDICAPDTPTLKILDPKIAGERSEENEIDTACNTFVHDEDAPRDEIERSNSRSMRALKTETGSPLGKFGFGRSKSHDGDQGLTPMAEMEIIDLTGSDNETSEGNTDTIQEVKQTTSPSNNYRRSQRVQTAESIVRASRHRNENKVVKKRLTKKSTRKCT